MLENQLIYGLFNLRISFIIIIFNILFLPFLYIVLYYKYITTNFTNVNKFSDSVALSSTIIFQLYKSLILIRHTYVD